MDQEISELKPYRSVARRFWAIVDGLNIELSEDERFHLYHNFCDDQDEDKLKMALMEIYNESQK